MRMLPALITLIVCGVVADAVELHTQTHATTSHRENPIRKVVTMLQAMQNKIAEEGKKAKEAYDKFMCWCENADTVIGGEISEAERKIPQLEADIKAKIALKGQLELEVKGHQGDRGDAEAAIKVALEVETKCVAQKASNNDELNANIMALEKAIAALEKGTYGGFLQTTAASTLRKLSISMDDLSEVDRNMLASFLTSSQTAGYVPQSQEIIGILKQMLDEMKGQLKEVKAATKQCHTDYTLILEPQMKRIKAAEDAIEDKLTRIGELGVLIATLKNDLEDTQEGLAQDQGFLRDLDKNCEIKRKEWALYKKTQAEELAALADTIKVLNDDDTLELLKKTTPSASASLLQVRVSESTARQQALDLLRSHRAQGGVSTRFDFLELALSGRKVSFDKIIKMIDELVAQLGKEQFDDDAKKEYCDAQLDQADDKKKSLDHKISNVETLIDDLKESITTLKSEIDALGDGIRALDKQVSEATETRKEDHAEYTNEIAGKTAAKEILKFAMNRLNKFYNPKLYKPPPKRELTEAERITVNNGGTLAPTEPPAGIAGTGITVLAQTEVAPAPEADLSYNKKGETSNGVIAMIKLLISDLEKDIVTMETDEKDAQEDYEHLMKDSAEKRATDSKALTDKEGYLAQAEAELLDSEEGLKDEQHTLMGVERYIMELHQECDFLLKYYSVRQDARAGEVDALKNAKAVLSGADDSL